MSLTEIRQANWTRGVRMTFVGLCAFQYAFMVLRGSAIVVPLVLLAGMVLALLVSWRARKGSLAVGVEIAAIAAIAITHPIASDPPLGAVSIYALMPLMALILLFVWLAGAFERRLRASYPTQFKR